MSLPYYHTHVCMVSDQPMANLLPLLLPDFKPRRVILLVTPAMRAKADVLHKVLRDKGCQVEQQIVAAYNFEAMRETVLQLVTTLDDGASFNLTGGTKIMALGIYDIIRDFDLPAFYLDTSAQQLILLRPTQSSIKFPECLTVKTALSAQGFTIIETGRQQIPPQNRALTKQLVLRAEEFQHPLAQLNHCAQKARKNIKSQIDVPDGLIKNVGAELMQLFQDAGLLVVDRQQLIFPSEQARFYVNGGWLEEYCFTVAQQLKREGHIHDLAVNASVQSHSDIRNEIDLALTARNQLHIVESKTANLKALPGKERQESRASEVSYKLDTLRDMIGGRFGKAMLVTFMKLRKEDHSRCASYNINVVEARQLNRLREVLLQWVNS